MPNPNTTSEEVEQQIAKMLKRRKLHKGQSAPIDVWAAYNTEELKHAIQALITQAVEAARGGGIQKRLR